MFDHDSLFQTENGENDAEFQQSDFNQTYHQPTSMTKCETIKIKEEDINYKNFPKMIGNNIVKWIKKNKYSKQPNYIPKGFKGLIELREREKQSKIKIKDLRDTIIDDTESQTLFQEYISDQLFLDLIFSNKVADPFSYIPGISNYYSAAQEPEKMKSNYFMRKEFINQEVQM
ncbi:unnamed protein product [Paramecium pentaurelia]|uniref:Uncharacterized protein n=1 Tax=Paramecium pentaurelia TaxID=43138 RepID=A0A8S1WE15_9CILI|nr:unnamed protein product [Paramecium pentaurelia]